jgi:DNA-binding transcriptional MerR regulator
MHSFFIGDMALLAGIKIHTLRLWEERYPILKTFQQIGRKRFYTTKDLQIFLAISILYHNGWKISKIVPLSDEERNHEVEQIKLADNNYPVYLLRLLQAAIDFNEATFSDVLNTFIQKIGFEKTIVEICYPYLEKIKLLSDTFSSQQHLSGYIISNRLIGETEKYSATQTGPPEIVLFSPGTVEELPLLFLNYLFRKNAWNVFYLGNDAKWEALKAAAQLPGIQYLYLHFPESFMGLSVDDYFEKLRKAFPEKIIIASGGAIQQSQRPFAKLQLLRNDKEIHQFIKSKT